MTLEWIENNAVALFRLPDTTRQSVDQFVAEVKQTREAWDKSQPFLVIYDASHGNILLTSYVRQRSMELAENPPEDLFGAYAVIVSPTIIGTLISTFLNLFLDKHPRFKGRAFRNFDQAVQWVQAQAPAVTR